MKKLAGLEEGIQYCLQYWIRVTCKYKRLVVSGNSRNASAQGFSMGSTGKQLALSRRLGGRSDKWPDSLFRRTFCELRERKAKRLQLVSWLTSS